MGGSSAKAPTPPSASAVSGTQTAENVDTALANATLSHTNQTDQYGNTLNYTTTGSQSFTDPVTGATYNIPQYSATQTFSPQNQALYNTGQQTAQSLAGTANSLSGMANSALTQPLNLTKYDPTSLNTSLNQTNLTGLQNADLSANNINKYINTNWQQPLANQQGQEMEHWDQQMADQGISLNDPAYNNAQYNLGQTLQGQTDTYANDMYNSASNAILSQAQLANSNLTAENSSANTNADNIANFANNATQQNNSNAMSAAGFNNSTNLTGRDQYSNELSALLSGSQVSGPSWSSTPSTSIPTTDYSQISNQSYQNQLSQYNAQVAADSANNGGLFGLGGAVLGGLTKMLPFSDRRLKTAVSRVGELANGLGLYVFRYIWDDSASPPQLGLMADEVARVRPEAVQTGPGGFSMVNYDMAVL